MAITASVVLGPRVFTPASETDGDDGVVVVAAVNPDGPASPGLEAPAAWPPSGPAGPSQGAVPALGQPEAPVPAQAGTDGLDPPPATVTTDPQPTTTTTTTTTTTEPPTTTTEAPPPTTTTTTEAPPPAPEPVPPPPDPGPAALSADHADGTQEGDVSWYDLPGARAGVCAHRTIEKGTVVTVTNLDTGASITCTVDDRGPYTDDGKVLDLHRQDFSRLAPLDQGIFPARLDW